MRGWGEGRGERAEEGRWCEGEEGEKKYPQAIKAALLASATVFSFACMSTAMSAMLGSSHSHAGQLSQPCWAALERSDEC